MSNPLKAVTKTFKKVVKVVKKVALPALAIGAVVLTGGAALGALPSVGSVLGGLGLSPALTGILTSAAKSAAFGAIGSALTGGSIIKGATTGFIVGGAMGGLGALAGKGAQTAAAAQGGDAAQAVTSVSDAALPPVSQSTSFNEAFAPLSDSGASSVGGLGTAGSQAGGIVPVNAPTPAVSGTMSAPVPTSGGALLNITGNPIVDGQLISGLGQGLIARENANAWKKEAAYNDAKWDGVDGFYQPISNDNSAGLGAAYNRKIYGSERLSYDPRTGLRVAG